MNSSPNNNNNNSTTRNTTMSSTSNHSNNSNSNNSNNKTGSSSNLSSLQPESLNIITGNMNTIPPVSRNTNASDEYNVTSPTSLAVAVRESMLDTSNTNSNQARNTTTNSRMSSSKQLRDSAGATISDNTRVTSNLSSRFSSRPFFSSRRSASELELHEKAEINSTPTLPDVTLRDSSAITSSSSSHRSRSKTGSKRSIFRDTVSFLARDSTQYTIPENTPTTCEGYLTKRGHVVTNWKTRYFVLKGDILIYYNDENSANNGEKPLGQVKVEKVSTWSGETNGFMFYTGKQIPYYVYAASEFECSKWIKAMKDFIVQQDPVDCEGYLTKRGHLVPSYRLRYFVLRGMSLKYYTDRDSFLANQSAVAEMEVTNVAKWNGEKTGIVFRTSTGNLLYLYADSVQDQMKWLQCLSNVARRNSITSTGTAALAPSSNGNGGLSMGENVIWSGYLKKQGHKRKSWKKRYFVLRSTGLSYYPDHESAVTKGIAIAEVIIQEVQVWDGAGPYGLMIMTTDQIPYYFLAENERDRMQWISHMRSSVSSSQNTNLTDRPEVGPPSSLLSQEKKSTCPRCQAVLTGTRFCGACGHKTRNTLTENDPVLATEITTNEEADPVVTENDTTETPFDELEALSEGARTLLLAVMQTPEGINIGDTTGAFPSRMSSRRVDKRGSSGYLNNIEDLEKAIQETEEELETKQTADEESKKASDKSQDLELSKEIDEEKKILPETDTKSPVLLHKRTTSKHADVTMEKDSIDNGNDPQSQKNNGANDHAVTETAPKPDPIDKTLEQRGNQVAANKVERRTSTDAVRSKQSFDDKATENSKKTGRKSDHGEDEEEASFYDTVTLDTRGIAVLSQPEYKNPAESKPTLPPTNKLSKRDLYTVFEKELEFSPMYVPSADSPVRCRIYGSMNYMSAASVIFFLSDSGPLGLWKVESGTENAVQLDNPRCMFSYLSRAQEEGYGILLSNPYTNSVTVYEEGGIERIVSIPKSSTPTEHVEFLWENMLLPCKGMISIIAYGQGGALTKYLLEKNESVARSRIHRIGFIESLHSIEGNESPGFLELIGRRAIHWESSNVEAVGGQMVESQTRYGCVCLSSGSITKKENGKPPDIFSNTEEGIFSFLKANPDRPGMTAIVGYIRAKLRRKRLSIRPGNKQPVSGVVVLGETRLENEDSMNQENSENLEEATPTKRQGTDDNEIKSKSSNPKSAYYLPRNNSSSRTVASSKQYPTMSVKDFELQKIVGQGGFGKVYLAKKITEPQLNRYFAMKVLKKNHVLASGLVNTTMAERHILTEISHPFIVKLHYAFQSENKLYLVMDYLPGGSLALHLRRKRKFSEEYAVFYAAEIASAMAHLHYVNIVYRDAKLENVLMDHEGHVRITDFGLSKVGVSGLQGATTFCGTAAYIAPELLQGNSYGKAADWWSFGILLYEMIGGKPPYYHRNRDIMFQTILKQEWVTFSPSFSDSAVSLIRGLLTREPTKRLGSGSRGADEILTHPFFNSIDWENLLAKKIQPPFSPGVGEYDTYYAPRHLLNNEITPGDREASLVIKKPNQKNDFDGFSFVGRSPQLNS